MAKFSENMLVSDALKAHPGAARVFKHYGLMCAGCGGAPNETILQAARTYGISLKELLGQLNDLGNSRSEV